MDNNIRNLILKMDQQKTPPAELNFESSDLTGSGKVNEPPKVVSDKPLDTPLDRNTCSNFGRVVPGDGKEDMSDSAIPRHVKPRHSRTLHNNSQRRPTPHTIQPSSLESTSHRLSSNYPIPSLHYSTSPQPTLGGAYVGQYTMSSQQSPMGTVHSPSPFPYPHSYHHPIVPDTNIIPQNVHTHYQPVSRHPHAALMYRHSQESSPLLSSFPGTGPTPMYPTHQVNPLGPPTSPHQTPPAAQNSPIPQSYIGSGVFHSLPYPSPMPTPHYTYSPPFPGTPPYQSQYPPPQFGQHYSASRDGEPQGDWYYVPRGSPVGPSQQSYDAGPSYSGHYPPPYPQVRPELNSVYSADSFSSANPTTPYPLPPFYQHSETSLSELPRGSGIRAASSSPESEHLSSDKPIVRQPYHPNPPAHRSEWVMWAGNIPSDATHDEIYRFFSQAPEDRAARPTSPTSVVSVFLISRSNCAFINFESETSLQEAISRFNGVPLRADDARCARLVCRVRHNDDDLKAGVGGQRGTGMHTRWVKEQKKMKRIPEQLANRISNFSLSSDDSESGHAKHSSTSDSYSSSNSSFLARHFPKRYFILKSLTQHDLDLSVQTGYWATQKHNEGILDQSYRTSKDVYLIFGANKSGEFYGYARMAGPVRRGGQSIHWAPSPPRSNQSPTSGRLASQPSSPTFFSPGDHRLVDNSPLPLDGVHGKSATDPGSGQPHNHPQSAPGMFGAKYDFPSMKTPEMKYSLDQARIRPKARNQPIVHNDDFELDFSAPIRAMRSGKGKSGSRRTSLHSLEKVEERAEELVDDVQESTFSPEQGGKAENVWGDCFAVEWISTERLPFHRTRQIRNPWNHDREVKVSRDGTELEPTVGQRLLDEWHRLADRQQDQLTLEGGVDTQAGHGGGGSKPAGSSSKRPALRLTTAEHRSAKEGK